jgi:hypothetical protein
VGVAQGEHMSETDDRAIAATIEALRRVDAPRHFASTERGYQGWLFCAIQATYFELSLLNAGRIVEMEYQKTAATHGTIDRPDIVVHRPRDSKRPSPRGGNLAVFELKKLGRADEVAADLTKLQDLVERLDYRLAFFVNIGADDPGMHQFGQVWESKVHAFSTRLGDEGVEVKHEWNEGPEHDPEMETLHPGENSRSWPSFEALRLRPVTSRTLSRRPR